MKITNQELQRVNAGLQCPECFSVDVNCRYNEITK